MFIFILDYIAKSFYLLSIKTGCLECLDAIIHFLRFQKLFVRIQSFLKVRGYWSAVIRFLTTMYFLGNQTFLSNWIIEISKRDFFLKVEDLGFLLDTLLTSQEANLHRFVGLVNFCFEFFKFFHHFLLIFIEFSIKFLLLTLSIRQRIWIWKRVSFFVLTSIKYITFTIWDLSKLLDELILSLFFVFQLTYVPLKHLKILRLKFQGIATAFWRWYSMWFPSPEILNA